MKRCSTSRNRHWARTRPRWTPRSWARARRFPSAYRLANRGGWKVYDVVIEGVSLVQNYRSQFGQILTNETPDALIAKIAAKKS